MKAIVYCRKAFLISLLVGSQTSSYTSTSTPTKRRTTTTGTDSPHTALYLSHRANDRQKYRSVLLWRMGGTASSFEETTPTDLKNDLPPRQSKMRVSELKSALDSWNVKYDDCFDQESLLVRYNEGKEQQEYDSSLNDNGTGNVVPNGTTTNATTAAATTTTTSSSPPISQKSNDSTTAEQQKDGVMESIRKMSVKELREELGRRRISRAGLFEKTDLIQAVYDARIMIQSFSVTGLIQPHVVTEVTGDQLQQEIINDSGRVVDASVVATPLLVDVYATWCGPCQLMSKQLMDVADEIGSTIRIVKMDSDQHTNMASQLRVQGLPTLILFNSNGKEVNRIEGAIMKDQLVQWIQQQLQ